MKPVVNLWVRRLERFAGKSAFCLFAIVSVVAMGISFGFAQDPSCTVITVPNTDEWRDWQIESIAGVTEAGRVAGTLVYRGQDSSIQIRKRIFIWHRADQRMAILEPPADIDLWIGGGCLQPGWLSNTRYECRIHDNQSLIHPRQPKRYSRR